MNTLNTFYEYLPYFKCFHTAFTLICPCSIQTLVFYMFSVSFPSSNAHVRTVVNKFLG